MSQTRVCPQCKTVNAVTLAACRQCHRVMFGVPATPGPQDQPDEPDDEAARLREAKGADRSLLFFVCVFLSPGLIGLAFMARKVTHAQGVAEKGAGFARVVPQLGGHRFQVVGRSLMARRGDGCRENEDAVHKFLVAVRVRSLSLPLCSCAGEVFAGTFTQAT